MLRRLLPVLAVLSLAGLTGCPGGDPLDPDPGCTHEGKPRAVGESFPAGDGCNSCACQPDGQVACTLIACQPGGGGTLGCDHGGKRYAIGDNFPATDGCNTCSCTTTGVACTRKACTTPGKCVRAGCSGQVCVDESAAKDLVTDCAFRPEYACYQKAACERQPDGRCGFTPTDELKQCLGSTGGCTLAGKTYKVGETFPSPDGCNSCSCTQGGMVACTLRACIGSCQYGGVTYKAGQSFPATDGCNTCTCGGDGTVACTKKLCPMQPCDFKTKYDYGAIGGLRASADRSYLAPGNSYQHERQHFRGGPPNISCAPPMPACGSQDVITAYDIETHDLPHPDVQAALARPTPPLFGRDLRPVDGTVFEFRRADGRGFLVGADCAPQLSSCQPIPAGIKQLRDRLLKLDVQQLATAECKKAGF